MLDASKSRGAFYPPNELGTDDLECAKRSGKRDRYDLSSKLAEKRQTMNQKGCSNPTDLGVREHPCFRCNNSVDITTATPAKADDETLEFLFQTTRTGIVGYTCGPEVSVVAGNACVVPVCANKHRLASEGFWKGFALAAPRFL
jgi:hypothetical protein